MALIHACRLEDRCFVGMKACVMDGAVVETGAWIAAGAVVTPGKRVKGGELWAGTPARFLRAVTPDEARYIEALPERYAELADQHRGSREPGGNAPAQDRINSPSGQGLLSR